MGDPAQPVPTLFAADDSGTLGDGITDVSRPRITGTAGANASIEVFNAKNKSLGTTTADASGTYVFQLPNVLPPGTYQYTVVATEDGVAGPPSPALSIKVVPVPAAINNVPALVAADDSGKQGDKITDVVHPRLMGPAGTTVAGGTVQILDAQGNVVATTTAGSKGGYQVQVSGPLAPGTYAFRARPVDGFGNFGAPSKPLSLTIVAPPKTPAAPSLLPADRDKDSDSQSTTLPRPRLTGKAPAGSTVQLLNKSGKVLDSEKVSASGTYIVQVIGPLFIGSHQFRVQVVDQYGDVSAPSAPQTIKVVLPASGPPFITEVLAPPADAKFTYVRLKFSDPMDPKSVADLRNYVLIDSGKDHKVGTNDDFTIPFGTVNYTAGSTTAYLYFKTKISAFETLQLTINVQPPHGIRGVTGAYAFSQFDGTPGKNLVVMFGLPASM